MAIKQKSDLVKLDVVLRGLPFVKVLAPALPFDTTLDRALRACPSPYYGGASITPAPAPAPSSNHGFFMTF